MATHPSWQCLPLQRDGEQQGNGGKALSNSSFFKELELARVHGWWPLVRLSPFLSAGCCPDIWSWVQRFWPPPTLCQHFCWKMAARRSNSPKQGKRGSIFHVWWALTFISHIYYAQNARENKGLLGAVRRHTRERMVIKNAAKVDETSALGESETARWGGGFRVSVWLLLCG